ncbi:MAG: 2-succinyl-5-enolpyruvyl-6-hydroxy-3-cyclohexene-1-carboxylic-acid synthase [Bacteroidota bacterium]|nr:2-succinyl-5-enolpyruvyl-6-hydroxy-3-cyclohexene-1-carboxylic-acid synthase [Bacteroidota bacterium]MDE2644453.1 2-succinyl-5-enolpyruvyl-6-hydroxy-3-cyclohexene-1-carboxylic-acid synthase [Bacteroidota bacterium]
MSQSNAERARLIIGELVRCGIDQFVIASGFRSAPLALAAASHPSAQVTVHFDERGSAFFALGYGRATRKPCVWITTSGTAVANGLPAVVESAMDEVPLICLTADRPPELRDTGANQTIDQIHIFGSYPKWFADLPAPGAEQDTSFIRTTIDYAVHRTLGGPVHLNCMFREPLLEKNDKDRSIPAIPWEMEGVPRTLYQKEVKSVVTLDDGLLQKISNAQRGLVVSGRLRTLEEGEAISNLANHLGWPLMADICAPVPSIESSVNFFDLIVRSKPFMQRHQPDLILHFGAPLVSKELQNFLANSSLKTYVAISPSDSRIDPCHTVTDRVQSTIPGFCDGLLNIPSGNSSDTAWRDVWMRADAAVWDTLSNVLQKDLSEPSLAWMLSDLLDSTNWVFGASSMPIRDLQAFFRRGKDAPRVFANRGASGIDGSLATAAGIAEAQPGCGTVLLGDLAMLHDVNSLNLLRERDVIIVVVNNNGGGIFHMLPVALGHEEFEKVLGTPHGMDFQWAAAQFQIPYSSVDSCEEFRETWQSAVSSSGPYLIEVQTERAQNAELHNALYRLVSEAVRSSI